VEENFKNKLGFFTFFIIVLALLIGGFFLTNYLLNKEDIKKDKVLNEIKEHRIDKEKDYIYFTNGETISEGAEIYYQDVVINLKNQKQLTETLEKENRIYKNNIQYLSDTDILSDDIIKYNNDNLYALTFREYKNYSYDKYVSLIVNEYNYSCFDLNTFIGTKSYVFDVTKDKLLSEDEILNLYKLTMDEIKEMVRSRLIETQKIVDEVELIKIDETLENFNNYSLYINEYGRLYISFLVKTTQVDYNEIMEVK